MNSLRKLSFLPTRVLSETLPVLCGMGRTLFVSCSGDKILLRRLHYSSRKQRFNFIEYDRGPCTADDIILQADKYGCSLVETVSSDFEMDKGLVKCFEKSFNHKILLKSKEARPGSAIIIPHKDCYIYYLVTREYWWDRGCYKYLRSALNDMKEHCITNNVKEICMGRLGSSSDGLNWICVRELVQEILKDCDLTVKAQSVR